MRMFSLDAIFINGSQQSYPWILPVTRMIIPMRNLYIRSTSRLPDEVLYCFSILAQIVRIFDLPSSNCESPSVTVLLPRAPEEDATVKCSSDSLLS
jgi:hypothetical protein